MSTDIPEQRWQKLPKWAQSYIQELLNQVEGLQQTVNSFESEEYKNTAKMFFEGTNGKFYAPPYSRCHIRIGHEVTLTLHVGDNMLHIYKNHSRLQVIPYASNHVAVE